MKKRLILALAAALAGVSGVAACSKPTPTPPPVLPAVTCPTRQVQVLRQDGGPELTSDITDTVAALRLRCNSVFSRYGTQNGPAIDPTQKGIGVEQHAGVTAQGCVRPSIGDTSERLRKLCFPEVSQTTAEAISGSLQVTHLFAVTVPEVGVTFDANPRRFVPIEFAWRINGAQGLQDAYFISHLFAGGSTPGKYQVLVVRTVPRAGAKDRVGNLGIWIVTAQNSLRYLGDLQTAIHIDGEVGAAMSGFYDERLMPFLAEWDRYQDALLYS